MRSSFIVTTLKEGDTMDVNIEPCKVPCPVIPPIPYPPHDTPGTGPLYKDTDENFKEWSDSYVSSSVPSV